MESDILVGVISKVLGNKITEADFVRVLNNIRMESLARLLHFRIASFVSSVDRRVCQSMIDNLSEEVAEDLLRSPTLCEILRSGEGASSIIRFLQLASASSSGDFVDDWSVIGDCWLGRMPPSAYPGLIRQKERYWSPRLACGVPVDLSLDNLIKNPTAGLHEPLIPSETGLIHNINNINGALEILLNIYTLGYRVFESLVSNIVIRVDMKRQMECWGATSGMAIGRLVIVNIESQSDIRMLGEALLHEAAHCAMDCAELIKPLWKSNELKDSNVGLPVVSPWTSNKLTQHAFLHACVVWAVLHQYWKACERHFGEDEISQRQCRFIENGFDKIDDKVNLDQALRLLTPVALDIVTDTKQFVRHYSNW